MENKVITTKKATNDGEFLVHNGSIEFKEFNDEVSAHIYLTLNIKPEKVITFIDAFTEVIEDSWRFQINQLNTVYVNAEKTIVTIFAVAFIDDWEAMRLYENVLNLVKEYQVL